MLRKKITVRVNGGDSRHVTNTRMFETCAALPELAEHVAYVLFYQLP